MPSDNKYSDFKTKHSGENDWIQIGVSLAVDITSASTCAIEDVWIADGPGLLKVLVYLRS